jgi:hypothetical protein
VCYKNKQYTNSGYALVGPKALLYINPHKESFFLFFISQFFYGMKSVNFIFVNQHTTQNFTIQKIQQKVLYVEKGIPFLALPGFLEPGGLPLARSSHPGRASKRFLILSSLKDLGWIWYSDIRSAQFLHTSRN